MSIGNITQSPPTKPNQLVTLQMHNHLIKRIKDVENLMLKNGKGLEGLGKKCEELNNDIDRIETYTIGNCYSTNIQAIKAISKDCINFLQNFFKFIKEIAPVDEDNEGRFNWFSQTFILIKIVFKIATDKVYRNTPLDGLNELREIRKLGRIKV